MIARRGPGPSRALMVLAWTCAAPLLAFTLAWLLGQLVRDEWRWGQGLFWIPSLAALIAAGAGWLVLRIAAGRGPGARIGRVASAVAALAALGHMLYHEVGWRGWPAATGAPGSPASFIVSHWNARWPGRPSLECGRALAPVMGDIAVISNPGSMGRAAVAELWLPRGVRFHDRGVVAVATAWTVESFQVLAQERVPQVGDLWIAWIQVRAPDGRPLRILAADLPSSPLVARGAVARAVTAILARHAELPVPDLVVGDLNCTPRSVVLDALAPKQRAAPPWYACGWLPTFPREEPMWRIDAMLAGPDLAWVRYQTLDLGIGAHKAQRGAFQRSGADGVSGAPPAK